MLVAIGINWEGRRCVLGVELARKELTSTWSDVLRSLLARGLRGVEVAVSDRHEGSSSLAQHITVPLTHRSTC